MLIVKCEQLSEQWFQEKLGKPSASNASKIITNNGKPSKQREGYLYELVSQRLSGKHEETYSNRNMEIGIEREEESRNLYEMLHEVEVEEVGVVYPNEKKEYLCSPDGIINREYGLEMKNVIGKTQVKYLVKGELPPEYFSQVQMSMLVTGFKRWDFFSYFPGIKPFIIRVKRDEKFIKLLEVELSLFCKDLVELENKLRR